MKHSHFLFVPLPSIIIQLPDGYYKCCYNLDRHCYEIIERLDDFEPVHIPIGVSKL